MNPPPMGQDLRHDRSMGERAELEAQLRFQQALWKVERYPSGKTGPDMRVTSVLGHGSSYWVEVRCKRPTNDRCYGLEENKLELWQELNVLYLIKDRERTGWYVAQMEDLGEPVSRRAGGSYFNNKFDAKIRNVYWPIQWWLRLDWEYVEEDEDGA